jgi:hypothetical protein
MSGPPKPYRALRHRDFARLLVKIALLESTPLKLGQRVEVSLLPAR